MIEYELDKIGTYATPPTPDAIDEVRHQQLQALKALRSKLLQITEQCEAAA